MIGTIKNHLKVRLRITFLLGSAFAVFVGLIIIKDMGLLSSRPKADESDGSLYSTVIHKEAVQAVKIDKVKLPECIDQIIYLSENSKTDTSCFVQFICTNKEMQLESKECTILNGKGECLLDSTIETCRAVHQWINDVSSFCECSS